MRPTFCLVDVRGQNSRRRGKQSLTHAHLGSLSVSAAASCNMYGYLYTGVKKSERRNLFDIYMVSLRLYRCNPNEPASTTFS